MPVPFATSSNDMQIPADMAAATPPNHAYQKIPALHVSLYSRETFNKLFVDRCKLARYVDTRINIETPLELACDMT